jgi:hypothetical protein
MRVWATLIAFLNGWKKIFRPTGLIVYGACGCLLNLYRSAVTRDSRT